MIKVLAISAAVSAAIVALIGALAMTSPLLFILFAIPGVVVGGALQAFIPHGDLRQLVAVHVGSTASYLVFGTWFLIVWVPCFYFFRHLRSNSTPHTDARANSVPHQTPPARADERER